MRAIPKNGSGICPCFLVKLPLVIAAGKRHGAAKGFSVQRFAVPVLYVLAVACDGQSALVLSRGTQGSGVDSGSGGEPSILTDAGSPAPGTPVNDAQAPSDALRAACTPMVTYENRDLQGSGTLFDQHVPDPVLLVQEVAQTTCSILYKAPEEVRSVPMLLLIVEDFEGIAAASAGSIHISSRYLQELTNANQDVAREITGLLYFTIATAYQNNAGNTAPIWLITGVADFVRLTAGYADPALRGPGGSWQDGYRTGAFFFDWLNEQYLDFVYLLNLDLAGTEAFDENVFATLTGKTVDALWADYQAALPP